MEVKPFYPIDRTELSACSIYFWPSVKRISENEIQVRLNWVFLWTLLGSKHILFWSKDEGVSREKEVKCLATKKRTVHKQELRETWKCRRICEAKNCAEFFTRPNCSFLFSGLFFVSEFASQNAAGGKKRVSLIKLYTNTQSFLLNKLRAIVTLGILVPNASNRCLRMPLAPNHASALYRKYLKTLPFFLQIHFYFLPR